MTDRPPDTLRSLASRLDIDPPPATNHGVDWALPLVAALRDRGVGVLLKLDVERTGDTATVVLSGPGLEGEFIRRDGPTLGATLEIALTELGRRGWD